MKARLKDNYMLDANHTLIAGAIVEVLQQYYGCCENRYRCLLPSDDQQIIGGRTFDGTQQFIEVSLLEIIDYTPIKDWEEIRMQAIMSLMPALVNKKVPHCTVSGIIEQRYLSETEVAEYAIKYADALVDKLKNKWYEKDNVQ